MSSTTSSANPISRSGRRMAFAGSLLAGGIAIGSLFSPMGLAGAQDDSSSIQSSAQSSDTTSSSTDDVQEGRRGPRGLRGHVDAEFLEDLLGLTGDELKAARADGATLAAIAAEQGVSESELVAALVEEATTRIAEAVEAGNLDADRAATMTENLEERVSDRVNRVPSERAERPGRGGRHLGAEVLADLGLDTDELRTAIQGGSTLSEAAAAQGVSEEDLAAAMTAAAEERLAAAVADGRIDEAKAAEIQAAIAERVQNRLDGVRPEGGRPGGPGGHGDRGGPGAEEPEA